VLIPSARAFCRIDNINTVRAARVEEGEEGGPAILPIKIAAELMTDKCRHDGLRGMSFTIYALHPIAQTALFEGRGDSERENVLITIGTIIDKRHLELDERGRVIRKARYASDRYYRNIFVDSSNACVSISENYARRIHTRRVRDKNYWRNCDADCEAALSLSLSLSAFRLASRARNTIFANFYECHYVNKRNDIQGRRGKKRGRRLVALQSTSSRNDTRERTFALPRNNSHRVSRECNREKIREKQRRTEDERLESVSIFIAAFLPHCYPNVIVKKYEES